MAGARNLRELIAWQLCDWLRRLVLDHTRTGAVSKDYDYRRQIRKSARSACYLTAEGFYRYTHREFGNYLNWARGSLGEALDQINEGGGSGYFTPDVHTSMKRICIRALKANVALRKSWRRNPPPPDGLQPRDAAGNPYDPTSREARRRTRRAYFCIPESARARFTEPTPASRRPPATPRRTPSTRTTTRT